MFSYRLTYPDSSGANQEDLMSSAVGIMYSFGGGSLQLSAVLEHKGSQNASHPSPHTPASMLCTFRAMVPEGLLLSSKKNTIMSFATK